MQPTHYAVPVNLAQAIASYLSTKPYNEVATIIAELAKCQAVEPVPSAKE